MQTVRPGHLREYTHTRLEDALAKTLAPGVLLALSGGLDSCVCLHLMASLAGRLNVTRIRAMHVNHGIHPDSHQWANFCQRLCEQHDVELVLCEQALGEVKTNREAVYRQARYQALGQVLGLDLLLTAHHQRDQAETVLYHLFRGTGVKGQGGMLPLQRFQSGYHVRPLLEVPAGMLLEYARVHKLEWIDDPSNRDTGFDRNYIRHQLLPVIEQRWPAAVSAISRSASNNQQSALILDEIAAADIKRTVADSCPGVIADACLSVLGTGNLMSLSPPRRQHALKYWIEHHGKLTISTAQLDRIYQDLCLNPRSAGLFETAGIQVRAWRGYLYLMPELAPAPKSLPPPRHTGGSFLFDALQLKYESETCADPTVEFRLRQGGESIRLNGHLHSVKKVLQEKGIPPWERQRIPLLYRQGELAVIAGVASADGFPHPPGRLIHYTN